MFLVCIFWIQDAASYYQTLKRVERITGAVVEASCLKLPTWKVRDRGLDPRSGIQVPKKQNVSSLLTRKHSESWGA